MNLHVFSDSYGLFPTQSCERISKLNDKNNRCVTLCSEAKITHPKMEYIQQSILSFKKYINTLEKIDKIIIHPIDYISAVFLLLIKKKFPFAKVYWICWSYDIYNLHLDNNTFYEAYSLDFKNKNISTLEKLKIIGRYFFNSFRIPFKSKYYLFQAYKHVNFFGSFLEQDYFNMKEITNQNHIKYIPFSYLSIQDLIPDTEKIFKDGDAIIIGHAGSLESNQYEIIRKIASLITNKKILLPLAYGNIEYINKIKDTTEKYNLKNLEIITEKIPMKEYYENLENASHAIFNLKVQQGLGNILGLLYMGKKVFLREDTSTYKEFKKLGLKIFSTNTNISEKEINTLLSQEDASINKSILFEKYNENCINNYWTEIVD
jgi:dTDP-N-acetylfucosamine:lipid II N-acetylfucosaminyltransferase